MKKDFENTWGVKGPKGETRMLSQILDLAVFPGTQGGPLEHVIAAKAVAFYEILQDEFLSYGQQVLKNAQAMTHAFLNRDYHIISGGTDNHLMLIDLRNKGISGKKAEQILVKADITLNKNMVPFDDKSPFITSGIRVGVPAITTRGLKEQDMEAIVQWIDRIIMHPDDEALLKTIKGEVNEFMDAFPLYPEL
jgi:glycine hydroxymethyltransferase